MNVLRHDDDDDDDDDDNDDDDDEDLQRFLDSLYSSVSLIRTVPLIIDIIVVLTCSGISTRARMNRRQLRYIIGLCYIHNRAFFAKISS